MPPQFLGLSDDDAFTLIRRVRWSDADEVVCPHCGKAHRQTSAQPARFGILQAGRKLSCPRPERFSFSTS
ncbi:MAG: transposase [Candidatus Accumulibacter sp.]|nr:transposase [Accumulibacter sp.]MBK8385138.1 transposase [Accumulibacter sp.]MBN8438944.1 transposase [Accumulibacter sp.]